MCKFPYKLKFEHLMSNEKMLEVIRKRDQGKTYRELSEEYGLAKDRLREFVINYKEFESLHSEVECKIAEGIEDDSVRLFKLYELLKCDNKIFSILFRNGVTSIEKLLSLSENNIFRLRRVGEETQDYIKDSINEYLKNIK